MKILVYMGHPAHFHLLKNPVRELEKKGHQVIVLIQKKYILKDLIRGSGFTSNRIPGCRLNREKFDFRFVVFYNQKI